MSNKYAIFGAKLTHAEEKSTDTAGQTGKGREKAGSGKAAHFGSPATLARRL
jgi:hypothetical protein